MRPNVGGGRVGARKLPPTFIMDEVDVRPKRSVWLIVGTLVVLIACAYLAYKVAVESSSDEEVSTPSDVRKVNAASKAPSTDPSTAESPPATSRSPVQTEETRLSTRRERLVVEDRTFRGVRNGTPCGWDQSELGIQMQSDVGVPCPIGTVRYGPPEMDVHRWVTQTSEDGWFALTNERLVSSIREKVANNGVVTFDPFELRQLHSAPIDVKEGVKVDDVLYRPADGQRGYCVPEDKQKDYVCSLSCLHDSIVGDEYRMTRSEEMCAKGKVPNVDECKSACDAFT